MQIHWNDQTNTQITPKTQEQPSASIQRYTTLNLLNTQCALDLMIITQPLRITCSSGVTDYLYDSAMRCILGLSSIFSTSCWFNLTKAHTNSLTSVCWETSQTPTVTLLRRNESRRLTRTFLCVCLRLLVTTQQYSPVHSTLFSQISSDLPVTTNQALSFCLNVQFLIRGP